MVGTFTKTIKGRKYTYFEYFEEGKTVQKYCGPIDSDGAKKKALEFEYSMLYKKTKQGIRRLEELRNQIDAI